MLSQAGAAAALCRKAQAEIPRSRLFVEEAILFQDVQRFQGHFMSRIDKGDGITAKLFKQRLDEGKMGAAEDSRIGTGMKDRFRITFQRLADFRTVEDAPFDEIGQGRAGLLDDFNIRIHGGGDFAMVRRPRLMPMRGYGTSWTTVS